MDTSCNGNHRGGTMKAVIYARVSSGMQADLGNFKDTKDENLLK